jgi:hypothetical protein
MANVKQIEIRGEIPYFCNEDDTMRGFLATLNGPCIGIRISYSDEPSRLAPNADGSNGQTAMYRFVISGREAVSYKFVDALLLAITGCGGTVAKSSVRDDEGNGEYTRVA